jgi:hypothetical protein
MRQLDKIRGTPQRKVSKRRKMKTIKTKTLTSMRKWQYTQ